MAAVERKRVKNSHTQIAASVRIEEAELDIELWPPAETSARVYDLERVTKIERLFETLRVGLNERMKRKETR